MELWHPASSDEAWDARELFGKVARAQQMKSQTGSPLEQRGPYVLRKPAKTFDVGDPPQLTEEREMWWFVGVPVR